MKNNTTMAALSAIAALSLCLSVAYLNTLGDDSFIYRRLIDNFLETGRIEYNPGEPCHAMTSAIYFFLMTGLTRVFGWEAARYLISPFSHVFAVWALYGLGRRLIRSKAVLWVVLVAILVDPFYLRWFWAGWEMSFKIGAAAFAIWRLLVAGEKGGWRAGGLAGLAMAFAVLTRPEMLYLAGLGAVYLAARRFRAPQGGAMVGMAGYGAALFVGVLPWMLFAKLYFGWALPHTVHAKASGFMTWEYLQAFGPRFMQIMFVPALPLYLALAAVFVAVVRKGGRLGGERPWRVLDPRDFLLVGLWGSMAAGYLLRGVYVDGIKLGLFSPFVLLSVGAMLDMGLRWLGWGAPRSACYAGGAMILLLSVGIQARVFYRFSSWNPRYAQGDDVHFIEFARRIRELTPPDARIGISELGVVGYYSERYMVDYVGLATPQIVAYFLETGNKADAVAKYYERHGGPPSHVVHEFRFNPEEAPAVYDFWGYRYRLVDSERIVRIAGRTRKGEYSIYALYERDLELGQREKESRR